MKKAYLALLLTAALALSACGSKEAPADAAVTEETSELTSEKPVREEAPAETQSAEETVAETESEEESITESKTAPIAAADLSDDIYSYQVAYNGVVMEFPMWYSDFAAMGWEMDDDDVDTLEPYQYTFSTRFIDADGNKIYARLANMRHDVLPYTDCLVVGFSVDEYDLDKTGATISIPGGLAYNVATRAEAEALYGTPSFVYEGDMYDKLSYEEDTYNEYHIYFDKEKGTLEKVELLNIKELEGGPEEAEVSSEVPEVVTKYQAPKELGDEPLSFNVDYAGDLYTLPAPVSVFLENGWEIIENDTTQTVAGRSTGWISIRKDNQKMRSMVKNYADKKTTIENCFIISVKAGTQYAPIVDLKLPGGFYVGMPTAEFEKLIANYKNVEVVDNDSYTYYCIGEILERIEFNVDENEVYEIEVENEPKNYE